MKIVFTETEVKELLLEKVQEFAPEGKVADLKIAKYSSDYATVTFRDPDTNEDSGKAEEGDF